MTKESCRKPAQFSAWSHGESQLGEFRSSPTPTLTRMYKLEVTNVCFMNYSVICCMSATYTILVQVYLLVCLTASKASPLFPDEPNIENLIDQFWDYFFFFLMGLPLDPGTVLMIRLSVILILKLTAR